MQTIATILADLTVLVTSILIIVTRVHGIFNRILSIAVVTTMCFFLIAYIATCANKGRCEWTSQEFKEVLYCTVRPDKCTHLLPQLPGAAQAEFWKNRASEHESEIARLKAKNDELRKGQQSSQNEEMAAREAKRQEEARAEAERQRRIAEAAREASRQAEEARAEAERQRRIAEAAREAGRQAEEARAEAERQRRVAEEEAERQRLADEEVAELRRQADAEAAELRRQEIERSARSLTFRIKSNYPYSVDVSFYSTRGNRAWPGGDQVWIISDSDVHTYSLNCIPGEQICFGAWVRGNARRYWGVGHGGQQGCTSCCYHCGAGDPNVIVLGP